MDDRPDTSGRWRRALSRASRPAWLALSLTLLGSCVLLGAELLGLREDAREGADRARRALAGSLAVHLTTLANTGSLDERDHLMSRFVSDSPDIRSVVLRPAGSPERTLVAFGALEPSPEEGDGAALDRIGVSVLRGGLAWGELTVTFEPTGSLRRDLLWSLVVAIATLASFTLLLGKVLVLIAPDDERRYRCIGHEPVGTSGSKRRDGPTVPGEAIASERGTSEQGGA